MASEGWFRKRTKPDVAGESAGGVPAGVATKCQSCGQILFTRDFEKQLKVCSHCGFHHKLTAFERLGCTVDPDSFVPIADDLVSVDPLGFPDYPAKLDKGAAVTGMADSMRIGFAEIDRIPVVIGVTDFFFMGGSMGSVSGEKITRAMETAIGRRLPVVLFTASGGARMHEGLLSLMQMAKTSAAAAQLAQHKLPFVVVITDPTTGGVLASFASLGDVIIAEPGALIGFAGQRVAAQASTEKPPVDYETAEWQLGRGQVDMIVVRRDIPAALSSLLLKLGCRQRPYEPADEPVDAAIAEAESLEDMNAEVGVGY